MLKKYDFPAAPARATSSFSSVTPGLSIRATTYDGKTLVLKRKQRKFTTILDVSVSRSQLGHCYVLIIRV